MPKYGKGSLAFDPTNSFFLVGPQTTVQNFIKICFITFSVIL